MEEFFLVRGVLGWIFCVESFNLYKMGYKFTKWCRQIKNWWYWWSYWERGRAPKTLRVIFTHSFGTWMNFYSFWNPQFILFEYQIRFSMSQSTYTSPCQDCVKIYSHCLGCNILSHLHRWLATTIFNRLILVLSLCCCYIILVTVSLKYHCASSFNDYLLLLFVTIVFSLSLHLLTIFFYSSLFLIDITFFILVATVSSSLS